MRKTIVSKTEVIIQLHQMGTLSREHQFLVDDTPNLMRGLGDNADSAYTERAHLINYLALRAASKVGPEYVPSEAAAHLPNLFATLIAPNGVMGLHMRAEWLKKLKGLYIEAHEGDGPRPPTADAQTTDWFMCLTRNALNAGNTEWKALHVWPMLDFVTFVDAFLEELSTVQLAAPRDRMPKHLYGCSRWQKVLAELHRTGTSTQPGRC